MKISRRIIATAAATAICAAAAVTIATAQTPQAPAAVPVAADGPGYAIETFEYPDGARIGAELGIVLKRGDGQIMLADCASSESQIQVFSRTNGTICFRAAGGSGQLTVEIPAVYGIRGDATHQTSVTLTAEGAPEQNIDVDKNQWKPVGEAADPQRRDHVLVDIRTTK
ncbi:hypothetical protein ACFY04_41445 [Streptomyces sp. NPDC001549]|uniref:hypothetical protein n=1 Tax=Streptomyces sp. NPDC001549 TaxID=3364586 RepID=UPI0036A29689